MHARAQGRARGGDAETTQPDRAERECCAALPAPARMCVCGHLPTCARHAVCRRAAAAWPPDEFCGFPGAAPRPAPR